jgi:transketolase
VLVGDGEMNEGSNWEALMTASKYGLDNLCCIIDFNKYQADGACEDILPWGDFGAKIRAFGCELYEIDGHSCDALYQAFQARQLSGCPKVILAHTVKGKGIEFMEHDNKWHHTRLRGVELEKAREVVGC